LRKYETIIVIDSLLKSEEIDAIISKYERFISANGGHIESIERWGKKRLAYEIKKRQYGYYILIRFDGPPTMIKPLEREYRLNESLLRYKTLLMTKTAIEALEAKGLAPSREAVEKPQETVPVVEATVESVPEVPAAEVEELNAEKPAEEPEK